LRPDRNRQDGRFRVADDRQARRRAGAGANAALADPRTTRELATQVEVSFEPTASITGSTRPCLIGGESFGDQERKLDRGRNVLIATPGRLLDLFERGRILLSDVRILVIDEADRDARPWASFPMSNALSALLPKARQTLFFSATMPPEIRRLADAFLNDPVEVAVAPPASPAEMVAQSLIIVAPEEKREALRRLIRGEDVKNALIFCNRKRDVDTLYNNPLTQQGSTRRPCTATCRSRSGPRRSPVQEQRGPAPGLQRCGGTRPRHRRSQSRGSASTCPITRRITSTVSAAPAAPGRPGRSLMLAAPEDGKAVAAIVKLIGKGDPAAYGRRPRYGRTRRKR